jgi:signal transduction histidine kinase
MAARRMHALLKNLSPRSSLTAGTVWLVVALAASFAAAASLLAGRVAREIVVQQHVRRLALETDQLGSDLGQAVAARLGALRALGALPPGGEMFQRLSADFPDLGWVGVVDADGRVVAGDGTLEGSVADQAWFREGLNGAWVGLNDAWGARAPGVASPGAASPGGSASHEVAAPILGDIALPLKDQAGRSIGVVAARLTWRWADQDIERLSAALDSRGSAEMLILDHAGTVLVGPAALRNRPWNGISEGEQGPFDVAAAASPDAPRFERQPSGRVALVARAPVSMLGMPNAEGWRVQLSEPKEQVYERADALAVRILWISICLAGITAFVGALGAGRLTERLRRLTASATAAGGDPNASITVPPGNDEVARLGAAFAQVLDDLRQERRELLALSGDLERRVVQRTREVERLAEESRYAAVVRERLKIARDLHDTLAHSMMAMLSEVRLLRKLQTHDPASLAEELRNAEQVAHAGLIEARTAIAQMRVNAVRDTGLGSALASAFNRFLDRTGLRGEFLQDPLAASFGDERAETLFRMAEEALRNIERHAGAERVQMRLKTLDESMIELSIEDDGVGFDPESFKPGHFGLVGLKEQAQMIGAEFSIKSGTGGTRLAVALRTTPDLA